jgi:F-type H+-transporting ATPase subunit gamma
MASLRDIKRRITSVTSTQKITRAMKMVAAAKLRRAQEAILQARPYAREMQRLVNSVAARADRDLHPLLRSEGEGKVGIIVVTSDRGLCGGFNANMVNKTLQVIKEDFAGREVELTLVGRKGIETLKRRPVTIRENFLGAQDVSILDQARLIIQDVVDDFMAGGTGEVYCLYNEFKSAVQQNVTLEKLLPISPEIDEEDEGIALDYLYEPNQEEVFSALLLRNMQIQMHRILFESAASEFGARMTAMDAATRNAGDVIDRLTLLYNRARQDAITTQLIEVVSGAEAL